MSGEYALLSGYLGKISAGVNQSATVMNTFKTVMQQSGETVKKQETKQQKADQMNTALTDSAEQAVKPKKREKPLMALLMHKITELWDAMTSAVSYLC